MVAFARFSTPTFIHYRLGIVSKVTQWGFLGNGIFNALSCLGLPHFFYSTDTAHINDNILLLFNLHNSIDSTSDFFASASLISKALSDLISVLCQHNSISLFSTKFFTRRAGRSSTVTQFTNNTSCYFRACERDLDSTVLSSGTACLVSNTLATSQWCKRQHIDILTPHILHTPHIYTPNAPPYPSSNNAFSFFQRSLDTSSTLSGSLISIRTTYFQ